MSDMPTTFTAPTGRAFTFPTFLPLRWLVAWRFFMIDLTELLTADEWERVQLRHYDKYGSLRIEVQGLDPERALLVDDLAEKYTQLTELDRDEFLRMIPVHERGLLKFVRLAEIPNPFRSEFYADSVGSTQPYWPELGSCAYTHDLVRWSRFRFRADYKLRFEGCQYRDLIDSDRQLGINESSPAVD